jgi:hypothetical protein
MALIGENINEAEARLEEYTASVNLLPEWEKREIVECMDILRRMILRYDSSAKLAIAGIALEIANTTPTQAKT